jgi:queuine tRNA-ribosyltransferase
MFNAKYQLDDAPLDPACDCPVCRNFSRAYIHHLFKSGEMLAMRLCVMHNIYFFNSFMEQVRQALQNDSFSVFYSDHILKTNRRI